MYNSHLVFIIGIICGQINIIVLVVVFVLQAEPFECGLNPPGTNILQFVVLPKGVLARFLCQN